MEVVSLSKASCGVEDVQMDSLCNRRAGFFGNTCSGRHVILGCVWWRCIWLSWGRVIFCEVKRNLSGLVMCRRIKCKWKLIKYWLHCNRVFLKWFD